jgi:hypothetical protein
MLEILFDSFMLLGILVSAFMSLVTIKLFIEVLTPDTRTEEQKQQDAADFAYRMKKLAEQDQVG